MKKLNIFNLCQELSEAISSTPFLEKSRKSICSFIRKRKMPFCDIIYFIAGCANRCIQAELDEYFTKKDEQAVTRQAFSKSRENIKHEAFIYLNDILIRKFEQEDGEIATYRGYRLFSADGTLIDLPNKPLLRDYFGFSSNGTDKRYAKGLAITAFDVLNKLTVFAELYRYDDSEKRRILDIVDGFNTLGYYPKSIWLLDRGYPSFELFHRFCQNAQNFLVRVSSQSLKEINDAKAPEQYISVTRKGVTLNLRVVNIVLPSGETEKLVTNLPDEFTCEDLAELYSKRWGIETNYLFLKKKLIVEVFTGETVTAVLQDFHCAILVLNIAAIAQREQEDILQNVNKHKDLKHIYHPSKSKLIADIKRDFLKLMIIDNPLHRVFTQFVLYSNIRRYAYHSKPNRRFERNLKSGGRRCPHPKSAL